MRMMFPTRNAIIMAAINAASSSHSTIRFGLATRAVGRRSGRVSITALTLPCPDQTLRGPEPHLGVVAEPRRMSRADRIASNAQRSNELVDLGDSHELDRESQCVTHGTAEQRPEHLLSCRTIRFHV